MALVFLEKFSVWILFLGSVYGLHFCSNISICKVSSVLMRLFILVLKLFICLRWQAQWPASTLIWLGVCKSKSSSLFWKERRVFNWNLSFFLNNLYQSNDYLTLRTRELFHGLLGAQALLFGVLLNLGSSTFSLRVIIVGSFV